MNNYALLLLVELSLSSSSIGLEEHCDEVDDADEDDAAAAVAAAAGPVGASTPGAAAFLRSSLLARSRRSVGKPLACDADVDRPTRSDVPVCPIRSIRWLVTWFYRLLLSFREF